jgi:hypothetical protein
VYICDDHRDTLRRTLARLAPAGGTPPMALSSHQSTFEILLYVDRVPEKDTSTVPEKDTEPLKIFS